MTSQESIRICFTKYADFEGTASRSEYWWFVLFLVLGSAAASILGHGLEVLFCLATLLPLLAAGARRLHDTGQSGWWQLIIFLPVAGGLVLAILLTQDSKAKAGVMLGFTSPAADPDPGSRS